MNEEQKNIETCLPESILAEVASVPTDPQFVSLTDEALDPLKQQAVQQAGSDAYNEVVLSHQPYTFTSAVVQMKSNLILLLRRLWRYPFGTGSLRSLADMWSHYITRLSGNETYGIPSRLSQLTDLPSAPLLVSDRKISGVPEAEDGISLVQLLCAANSITEVTDNTTGWAMTKAFPWSLFPNITKAHFGCAGTPTVDVAKNLTSLADFEAPNIEGLYQHVLCQNIKGKANMEFGSLKKIEMFGYIGYVIQATDCENLSLPVLHTIHGIGNGVSAIGNMPNLQTLRMPSLTDADSRHHGDSPRALVQDCAALQEIEFGGLTAISRYGSFRLWYNCPSVFKVIVGVGTSINLNLDMWSPTLDSSNLQQFLQNFRDYIADRLTDNGSGKTLTLSQAVFSAVIEGASPICDEIKGIIEDKGWKVQDTNNNIFPTT